MDKVENKLLVLVDRCVRQEFAQSYIRDAVNKAETELLTEPEKLAASVQVPIKIFGNEFPSSLKSCRVFVLRANTEFKTERHPNSHQRVLSLKGKGQIRICQEGGYSIVLLQSEYIAPIQNRWASVKENVWHQPVAGEENWAMLAFHTVSEDSLIDEYKK